MTTEAIAQRLVELARQRDYIRAQEELFSGDAMSIEPHETSYFEKETRGLDAIHEKTRKFDEMLEEVHGIEVSQPVIAPNSFACSMQLDVTLKGQGRMSMSELCVYQVKDGKIVSEQFFM
ncbi:MAG: nuclear transport factor 2 family protein [Bacteroidota bacterium]|nr:nuclear transport factor 2 family protein [Bacteroidota bacterium]